MVVVVRCVYLVVRLVGDVIVGVDGVYYDLVFVEGVVWFSVVEVASDVK